MKKGDNKLEKVRFSEFLVFENTSIVPELEKLTTQEVIDKMTLNEIENCYDKKYQALRIAKKNITSDLILSLKDPRAQAKIKTLSFPENSIHYLEEIAEKFVNVKVLNLSKKLL